MGNTWFVDVLLCFVELSDCTLHIGDITEIGTVDKVRIGENTTIVVLHVVCTNAEAQCKTTHDENQDKKNCVAARVFAGQFILSL